MTTGVIPLSLMLGDFMMQLGMHDGACMFVYMYMATYTYEV